MPSVNGAGPMLPDEVWNPLLAQFRDWMLPMNDSLKWVLPQKVGREHRKW